MLPTLFQESPPCSPVKIPSYSMLMVLRTTESLPPISIAKRKSLHQACHLAG
ncbi:hypothetical protein BDV59DRAFT_177434 [Aspergillus ambiguus]|uniref:uncharacterized protein n=1 Tax=Aspergillus ambiguus TaxID=176160 RepID=UPI003CCD4BD6